MMMYGYNTSKVKCQAFNLHYCVRLKGSVECDGAGRFLSEAGVLKQEMPPLVMERWPDTH